MSKTKDRQNQEANLCLKCREQKTFRVHCLGYIIRLKQKNVKSVLINTFLALTILVLLIIEIYSVGGFDALLSQYFGRFVARGFSSVRTTQIWFPYLRHLKDSPLNVLLGYSYSKYTFGYYDLHNSVLTLHSLFGMVPVVIFLIALYYAMKTLYRTNFLLCIILISYFVRCLFDSVWGHNYSDIFLCYFVSVPIYNKYIHEDKLHEEMV